MSHNTKTISHYEDTAYNSQDFPPQKPRREQVFLRRMITKGKLFDFFHSTDTLCILAINDVSPSKMAQYEAFDDGNDLFWNEKVLTHSGYVFWGRVYNFIATLSKACLLYMLPLSYTVAVLMWIFDDNVSNSETYGFILGLTIYGLLPSLLVYGHLRLVISGHEYLAPFLKIQRVFQLDRTTGMVTLYKKGKPYFTHPFIEFDCVLMSAPTHQGLLNYSLVLIHRYHNYSVGVPLGAVRLGPNEKVIEYLRFWNMIQRYMDISQPLPDIMMLEGVRQYDPTTITYDKEHNRNPRYWRDMTQEEFVAQLNEIHAENQVTDCVGEIIDIFKVPKPLPKKHNKKK
ncbi:hypothetical protein [Marinomonas sp.]|uniref:hypothetical protein n=1 Tax=Marinomonas sp. TaxID=1904862 RepID=UPI003BA8B440